MPHYYQKALEMYQELEATHRYSLFKEGDNPYVDMYKAKNDFNCEIIMALSCDPSATEETAAATSSRCPC